MIYARICKKCQEKYVDIVEKKRSKGCFQMVMDAEEKEECYLEYMHEEDENEDFRR